MKAEILWRRLLLSFLCALAPLSGLAAAQPNAIVDTSSVSAADRASPLAADWPRGAFIEIFVRGYRDSNGDGIGDLRGLTQSLDYLQDLGIRGIWLMPVTRSQDHDHGYAVSDYRDIEPAYGSLADFDELLREAHARGIGVIFDYVVNHSAAANPIFAEASASNGSRYRNWYVWREQAPAGWKIMGKDPWVSTSTGAYLAQFSPSMPDFNLLNAQVLAYHQDNLRFWMNRGVDGFRFDAVTHLVEHGPDAWYDQPEDYALMNALRAVVDGYAHRYVVCEATRNADAYAAPTVCGAAFALDGGRLIVDAARGKRRAIQAIAKYFTTAPAGMAMMVSNHDLFAGERLWDQVGGDLAQYRLAAATYLLQPGTPFIYYGEEIGMSAGPGLQGDPKLRTPMSWTSDPLHAGFSSVAPYRVVATNVAQQNVASQSASANSLLSHYKSLLTLRNTYPSIARGSYQSPKVAGRIMSYRRQLGGETALVVINYGRKPSTVTVPALAAGAGFRQVFPKAAGTPLVVAADGSGQVSVGAQSVQVYIHTRQ